MAETVYQAGYRSSSWTHNRLGRLSHKPLRRLYSSWNSRELQKTVKAVGRGRNRIGWLRTGRDARGGYGTDGWGGNRPKHSFYGDFRGTRTITLFPHGFWTGRREHTERDRVRSILMGKKERVGRRADQSLSWRPQVYLFTTTLSDQNIDQTVY